MVEKYLHLEFHLFCSTLIVTPGLQFQVRMEGKTFWEIRKSHSPLVSYLTYNQSLGNNIQLKKVNVYYPENPFWKKKPKNKNTLSGSFLSLTSPVTTLWKLLLEHWLHSSNANWRPWCTVIANLASRSWDHRGFACFHIGSCSFFITMGMQ